jgi:hypothetical protein
VDLVDLSMPLRLGISDTSVYEFAKLSLREPIIRIIKWGSEESLLPALSPGGISTTPAQCLARPRYPGDQWKTDLLQGMLWLASLFIIKTRKEVFRTFSLNDYNKIYPTFVEMENTAAEQAVARTVGATLEENNGLITLDHRQQLAILSPQSVDGESRCIYHVKRCTPRLGPARDTTGEPCLCVAWLQDACHSEKGRKPLYPHRAMLGSWAYGWGGVE